MDWSLASLVIRYKGRGIKIVSFYLKFRASVSMVVFRDVNENGKEFQIDLDVANTRVQHHPLDLAVIEPQHTYTC